MASVLASVCYWYGIGMVLLWCCHGIGIELEPAPRVICFLAQPPALIGANPPNIGLDNIPFVYICAISKYIVLFRQEAGLWYWRRNVLVLY